MLTKKIYISSILFLFALMPVVESLNGFLNFRGVSDVYRIATILFSLIYLIFCRATISKRLIDLILLIITFLALTLLQFLIFHKNQSILLSDLKSISRILLGPIYFVFFHEALLVKDLTKTNIVKLMMVYSVLFSVLVIVPYSFNFGFVSYDFDTNGLQSKVSDVTGLGGKGFFIELNSLVAILSTLLYFIKRRSIEAFLLRENTLLMLYGGIYLLLTCSLFITATKLGIALTIFCFGVLIVQILKTKERSMHERMIAVLIIALILIVLLIISKKILAEMSDRLAYFYDKSDENLLGVLTSNRVNLSVNSIKSIDSSNFPSLINLFGAGYFSDFFFLGYKRQVTEMDFFDLYISYGWVGFVSYMLFWKNAMYASFFSIKKEINSLLWILILYSFIAGHIFVNPMTVTLLALVLSYSTNDQKNDFTNQLK